MNAFAPKRLASIGTVVLAGCAFGWYVPYLFSGTASATQFTSSLWWCWPLVFLVLNAVLVRIASREGIAPEESFARCGAVFLPGTLVAFVPFVAAPVRVLLVVAALAASGVLAWRLLRRSEPWSPKAPVFYVVLSLFFAAFAAATALSANAALVPGISVSPIDGDNNLTWFNDGLHGRLPYKNFYYPYAPLTYVMSLWFAWRFGLDSYLVPLIAFVSFVNALIACYTATLVFRTRWGMALGGVALFWLYGPELRVWAGYLAVVAILNLWNNRERNYGLFCGILVVFSALFGPEVATAAMLGGAAALGYDLLFRPAAPRRDLLGAAAALAAGTAGALLIVVGIGLATGTLGPYIANLRTILSVVDTCCGLPFATFFNGDALTTTAHAGALWILNDPIFRQYYVVPLAYALALVYLVVLHFTRGPLEKQDRFVLGIAIFGIVLFRGALGRSDLGHVQFSALPAFAIYLLFAERALATGWQALRRAVLAAPLAGERPAEVLVAWSTVAMVACGLAFISNVTGGGALLPAQAAAMTERLSNIADYYAERYVADRPPSGWIRVKSVTGGVFYFEQSDAADVEATVKYLASRMHPQDSLYGVPYVARYQFLLGRATPVDFGQELWSAAARPSDQMRLTGQLAQARPRYIIYDETEAPDYGNMAWVDRMPILADFIFKNYHVERLIGKTVVLAYGAQTPPVQILTGDPAAMPYLSKNWSHVVPQGYGLNLRWTGEYATARLTRRSGSHSFFVTARLSSAPIAIVTVRIGGQAILQTTMYSAAPLQTFQTLLPKNVASGPVDVTFSVDSLSGAPANAVVYAFGFGSPPAIREVKVPLVPLNGANIARDSAPVVLPARAKPSSKFAVTVDQYNASSALVRGKDLVISGWAADNATRAPASPVFARVDGGQMYRARTGMSRKDVGLYLNTKLSAYGFVAIVPTSQLSIGKHTVTAVAISANGKSFTETSRQLPFTIVP